MSAVIVIATSDVDLAKFFSTKQNGAIPPEFRAKCIETFGDLVVLVFQHEKKNEALGRPQTLSEYLIELAHKYDHIACLVDFQNSVWVEDNGFGMFVTFFERKLMGKTVQNYFSAHFKRWLPNFMHISMKFMNASYAERLFLPYEIFRCSDLPALGMELRGITQEGSFRRRVDDYLAGIERRRKPMEKGGWKEREIAYQDDRGYFFKLGKEKHSEAEEGAPHKTACRLEKYLRFGSKIPDKRHFNVSAKKGERVGGDFITCHSAEKKVEPTSHLNIFPNNCIG